MICFCVQNNDIASFFRKTPIGEYFLLNVVVYIKDTKQYNVQDIDFFIKDEYIIYIYIWLHN